MSEEDVCIECNKPLDESVDKDFDGLCRSCWIEIVKSTGGNPIAAFLPVAKGKVTP